MRNYCVYLPGRDYNNWYLKELLSLLRKVLLLIYYLVGDWLLACVREDNLKHISVTSLRLLVLLFTLSKIYKLFDFFSYLQLNVQFVSFVGSRIRARALLCPVGSTKGQPLPMQYRNLSIGTGSEVDLCLTDYGYCNNISAQHACIFYDEVPTTLWLVDGFHNRMWLVDALHNSLWLVDVVHNKLWLVDVLHK